MELRPKTNKKECASILLKLKKYINQDDENLFNICKHLGYSSTSTIHNWFRKESVPRWARLRLEEYFEDKKAC